MAIIGNEYDYIVESFEKVTGSKSVAQNFTDLLYQISQKTNIHVLELFESINLENELSLNLSMAYYLNSIGPKTALYGIQNPIKPNYYAGRNVLE